MSDSEQKSESAPRFDGADTSGPPTARCSNCNADVPRTAKGNCARCGRFLVANVAAVVHGDYRDEATALATRESRTAFLATLFEERGGREAVDAATARTLTSYATAVVHLRATEAQLDGATGKQRDTLLKRFDLLSKRVEELRPPPPRPAATRTGALSASLPADMSPEVIERLRLLLAEFDAVAAGFRPPEPGEVVAGLPNAPGPDLRVSEPDAAASEALRPSEPNPAESGDDAAARDAAFRERDPAAWALVHGLENSPEAIERRREHATRVMLTQLARRGSLR